MTTISYPLRQAPKKGIVLVHGMGDPARGDHLYRVANQLLRYLAGTDREPQLKYGLTDPGDTGLTTVTADLNEQQWVFVEAWWAQAFPPAHEANATRWNIGRVTSDLFRLWLEVANKELPAGRRRAPGAPRSIWSSIGLALFGLLLLVAFIPFVLAALPLHIVFRLDRLSINKFDILRSLYEWSNAGLTFLYLIIAAILLPLGLMLLSPLRMVSRFPGVHALIRAIERGLNAFLAGSIGDIQVYTENPIDARQIRAPLLRSLAFLIQEGCAEIYVMAHSAGTPICFEVLARDPALTSRVKRFFSYGSITGIIANSPSKVRPALMKSLSPVPGTFGWDNFCSKYDVAGPDIVPDGVEPDVNILVRNEDSVRTDHVTYEYNLRQFVGPIVECIWAGGSDPPRTAKIEDEPAKTQDEPQENRAMRLGMRRIAYALVLPIFFAFVFWSAFTWWTKVLVVEPTWITWLTGDLGVESWAQKHLTDYDEYGLVTTYDEDGKIQKTLVNLTEDCGADAALRPVPQDAAGQHVVVLNPCTPENNDSLGVDELWEKLLTGALALLLLIPIGFLIFSFYRNSIWWPKEMDLIRSKPPIKTLGWFVLTVLRIVLFAVVLLVVVVSVWEAISFLVLDSASVFDSLKETLGSPIVWAVVVTTILIAYDFIFEKDRADPTPYVRP